MAAHVAQQQMPGGAANASGSPAGGGGNTAKGSPAQHTPGQSTSGNNGGGNTSSGGGSGGPVQHRRVYQACIPCRKRKVKCDLGSVDNPSAPPCVRCRREFKECFFSVTRRKQKLDENDEPIFDREFVERNKRKRTMSEGGSELDGDMGVRPGLGRGMSVGGYRDTPLAPVTPGGAPSRRESDIRESRREPERDADPYRVMTNPEAQSAMRDEIYGPHDALNLLYKAATDDSQARELAEKRAKTNNGAYINPNLQRDPKQERRPQQGAYQPYDQRNIPRSAGVPSPMRPASTYRMEDSRRMEDPGYKTALMAWSRFRFVRAGWFTPHEAIAYIDYYYKYLSPLTPISPPTFQNPSTHVTLLQEEPILVVTLLTIASRYLQLPGTGGICRSFAIHEQLWTYLRGMIERCLWGQESFGGGFCGSGATDWEQTSSTAPWRGLRKGSLRTLGTVESLMILTEWHPRGLHFPPQDATDELMLPMTYGDTSLDNGEDGTGGVQNGIGGKRIEGWLEPAWRSDRMCWMLLSTAHGLCYELGVFDALDQLEVDGELGRPEYEDEGYRLRAERIKKLILIYITQLSGRLGWTNMVTMSAADLGPLFARRRATDGSTPGTNTSLINSFNYIPDLELDDQIIHCWAGITSAMRAGNDKIFRNRKYTTDIITSGKYLDLLAEFQPILTTWKMNFDNYNLPQYIRHILTIEYEYVRIYVNSLSLQAVVERSSTQAASRQPDKASPNFLNKIPMTLYGGFTTRDGEYVKEVVEGSRNLLRTVVDGLLPNDYLKHAPVRTYFRIISGAMFLLKTFALGASKSDVEVSIGLMDRAVMALRDCVVDDVHLGTRFADLLQTLTTRLRNRFMHAPVQSENGNGIGGENSESVSRGEMANNGNAEDGNGNWNGGEGGIYDGQDINISATAFDLGPNVFFGPTYHNPVSNTAAGAPQTPNFQPTTPANSGNPNQNNPANSDTIFGQGDWGNGVGASDLWYLPPGAAFFQNADQGTTQTAEGVNLGGMDLLDYMAMDPFVGGGMGGMMGEGGDGFRG